MKPELLAPGGSFLSAWYALQAGADGVYLGMREFSARKAAANFSPEQLRRLLGAARERGGRVYLALNTVVREQELPRAAETLHLAQELGLDGVIVQDLGVAELARRHFPSLPLHASTQLAVHNAAGLRVARELGFRRVILSRELDLASIRALREGNPDIELEVFIHGALCYSFSGLCLASWALTGRSGNRGDCAQICRSLFRSPEGEGYLFSCRDLHLGREARELAALGIDALKIEGRMKSPEYVFHTVKLYRAILDRGEQLEAGELEELERRSALGFARERTRAWLRDPRGERLLDSAFPGHRGAPLGTVRAVREGWASLRLDADLSLRDGLQYFPADGASPVQFSVRAIRRGGRRVPVARRGELVEVELPAEDGSGIASGRRPGSRHRPPAVPYPGAAARGTAARRLPPPAPREGQLLYQLSSRLLDLPQPKEGGFRPYRRPCAGTVQLRCAGSGVDGQPGVGGQDRGEPGIEPGIESRPAPPCTLRVCVRLALPSGREFAWQAEVPLERAAARRDFAAILGEVFAESGDCLLRLEGLKLENLTGLAEDALFVPPSALKKARAAFYRALEAELAESRRRRLLAVAEDACPLPAADPPVPEPASAALLRRAAQRRDLCPAAGAGDPAPHPFVGGSPDPRTLAAVEGWRFLPLAPVARAGDPAGRVEELLRAHPEERFAVGLSNLAHLELARRLADLPHVRFFADFPLYAANRFTACFLARQVPGLLYATHWLEGEAEDARALERATELPLVRLEPGFRPPLFYGMGCPRGQGVLSVEGRRGCRDCPGGYEVALRQGGNRFRLRVRDCTSYLYAD